MPDYWNLGDSFIWLGEREFYKTINITNVSEHYGKWDQNKINSNLGVNDVVSLQGDGNFGDLYRRHQNNRLKACNDFSDKTIVAMPQSIYYQDQKKMISDAKIFGRFENLHLIARCRESFNILKSHFSSNQIHLAPDMAFLIGEVKPLSSPIYDVVFLSRNGEKAGRFKNIKVFEALMSKANLSYKILDWHDWSKYVPKGAATPSYGDFNLPNFRLDAANRILSLGKIVLSDRMHAIILG